MNLRSGKQTSAVTEWEILLYYPNIIGYIRILLVFVEVGCFVDAEKYYYGILASHFLGVILLDEIDGKIARAFNQASRFGATLDLVVDIWSQTGILMGLTLLYPNYCLFFQLLSAFYMGGFWFFQQGQTLQGRSEKDMIKGYPIWFTLYYTCKPFHLLVWGSIELILPLLCVIKFDIGPLIAVLPGFEFHLWTSIFCICLPFAAFKTLINVMHLIYGSHYILQYDIKQKSL